MLWLNVLTLPFYNTKLIARKEWIVEEIFEGDKKGDEKGDKE